MEQSQGTLVDPLREEHAVLREGLSILQRAADRCARSEPLSVEVLQELLDLILHFGDHEHLAKEEQALLPALHAAGMPLRYGPLSIALLEHGRVRAIGREVSLALRGLPAPEARAKFIPLVGEFVRVMRTHLEKEEAQLFPMATQIVPLERISAVREAYERIEQQTGTGGVRRVRARLEELAASLAR